MSLETELEALRAAAAIFPLTDRAFLRITGPDATRWLNGMVTNNIKDLAPGEGNYNFLLNAQGRIQGDCTIYREPNDPLRPERANADASFLLATDKSQVETIHQLLDKFIIMDDVELTPTPSNEQTLLLLGPNASEIVHAYYASFKYGAVIDNLPATGLALLPDDVEQVTTRPDGDHIAFESTGTHTDALLRFAKEHGATEISPEALEAHRILSATPKYGTDIRNTETAKDLPQETAQTHALHFNKGCYLGQEIVERIRSRGQVHRTFTAFTLTGSIPQLPAPLEAHIEGHAKPAGELTSAIQIGPNLHALGYLRREFATLPLTYPNGAATPKNL
jgi:folate-binding protein YgfZ